LAEAAWNSSQQPQQSVLNHNHEQRLHLVALTVTTASSPKGSKQVKNVLEAFIVKPVQTAALSLLKSNTKMQPPFL
jgi:hypothetical protein